MAEKPSPQRLDLPSVQAIKSQFAGIATDLNSTKATPDATLGYDLFADGIVWSDEFPSNMPGRIAQFDCVRILLRYRTTCILGCPDARLAPYWDVARKLFPRWAGFDPSRQVPSDFLKAEYERMAAEAMRSFERLDKLYSRVCERGSNGEEAQ